MSVIKFMRRQKKKVPEERDMFPVMPIKDQVEVGNGNAIICPDCKKVMKKSGFVLHKRKCKGKG